MLRERTTVLCYTAFVSRVSFCFWRRENFLANAIHTIASLEPHIIWRFLRIKYPTNRRWKSARLSLLAQFRFVAHTYIVFQL